MKDLVISADVLARAGVRPDDEVVVGRVRAFDFPPCFHCGGCPLTESNREDCYGNPAPVCGECLWAQGIVLCP